MTTFIGSCTMLGTGSLSGVGFGNQNISSASYGTVASNQISIDITGIYTTFDVTRNNLITGDSVTFYGQSGSAFIDNTVQPNTQYSYSIVPITSGNAGPTFPLQSVWTLVNVTMTQFSYTYNSVQLNWTGQYSSISISRISPTTGTPTGDSSNYPSSSSPQASLNGYLIDTNLPFNTYIYTIDATNGAGVTTNISSYFITSVPSNPPPTFGTPANVTSTSFGTYNYWIITGDTTVTFSQPTQVGYLLVGGGGPGGSTNFRGTTYASGGGGGGGGGICWSPVSGSNLYVDDVTTYFIAIGKGGIRNRSTQSDTIFDNGTSTGILVALGGERGLNATSPIRGIGGGGGGGGYGLGGVYNANGGAGGAGGKDPAGNYIDTAAGNGADGTVISLDDIGLIYQVGAGGGGGSSISGNGGTGGLIGGGNGTNSGASGAAATYYGAGGGGTVTASENNNGYQGFAVIYY